VRERVFSGGTLEINFAEWESSGPPLIFLHGLATRWQIFRPLIPELANDWHVYALDLRGHGKSGHAPGKYSVDQMAEDTITFLENVGREPAVLFGHSMGGWVAAETAARRPDLVLAIVLADTSFHPAPAPDDDTLTAVFGVPATTLRGGSTNAAGGWPQSMRDLDPDVVSAYIDGRLIEGFDATSLLSRVACPVLLLQGSEEHGGFMSDDDVEEASRLLDRCRHVRFERAGHWLHVQDADLVIAEFNNFMAEIRKASQPRSG
jgi:pimeloyl-ACP methyl ester carboxylesterase